MGTTVPKDQSLSGDPGVVGPLRDKYTETIGTDDFELERGFICVAATTGDITYRTLTGAVDQTETIATAGTAITVAGVPVLITAVRGSSSVTSIVVGIP